MAAATEAARRQGAQSRRLTDLKHEIVLFECHLMRDIYKSMNLGTITAGQRCKIKMKP